MEAMSMIHPFVYAVLYVVAGSLGCLTSVAQQVPKCHGAPVVWIEGDAHQQSFHFEQKVYRLFPLDAVADYDEACHQTSRLTIVAAQDVPFHVMLEAAGNSSKLEIEKTRIFVRIRDHYNEVTVGNPVQAIPVD
jgi:hypothetical protein